MRRLLPLALLAALPVPAAAQTAEEQERDRGFLTGLIEDQLSSTARSVVIEGFQGALSSRATVDSITIADAEGVWLRAEGLVLDWNRSALFGGRIEVEELSADTIEILRPPVADPAAPTPEATPFSLPELPVSVEIGALRSDRIVLGEALLGERLALGLEGSFSLSGGEGEARVAARIVEGSEGSLDFSASYSNGTRILALDLALEEAPGGLAARALDLPGLPSVALSVEGTAPLDEYVASLSLATGGVPRVTGDFALTSTDRDAAGQVLSRAFGLDLRGDLTPLLSEEAAAFFGPDVGLRAKGIRRADGSLVVTSLGLSAEAAELSGEAEITPQGWPARLRLEGTIGTEGGAPVPLPGAPGTTVERVTLDLDYDRAEGEAWTGTFAIRNLFAPGVGIPDLTLDGAGTIVPATEAAPGRFTGLIDYAATGLDFADQGLEEAIGSTVSGRADILRDDGGGPLRLRRLTLAGPGVAATAEGTVETGAGGFVVQSSILLQAGDLARFATLAGLDLGGAADLTIVSAVRPLDGIFDVSLSGATRDLRLGIDELDPLLAGEGTLSLLAARDESGTRLDGLAIATPALDLTAEADITSGESRATFDLALADIGLSLPDLSGAGRVTGTATRDGLGGVVLDARAQAPGLALDIRASRAAGTGDAPGPVAFAVAAEVEDAAPYAPLLRPLSPDLAPAGALSLDLSGTAAPDLSTFDLALRADTQDLALGLPRIDPLLAGEGALFLRAARTGPGSLTIEEARVATDLLSGTAEAAFRDGTGTARLDLTLAEVAALLPGLEGPARLSGTASPAADGAVALDLTADLPGGQARVDGTVSPADGYAFAGGVALGLPDLAPFGALLGRDLAGAVRADLAGTLRPDLSAFDLTADARTEGLALGLPRLDPLLAGEGTLRGRVARSGPDSFRIEDVRIATDLLSGTASAAFAEGTGRADFDLTLAEASALLPGLSGPARVAGTAAPAADGTVALDVTATLPDGSARIDGTLAPADGYAFAGDAALDLPDLAPFGPLLGRALGGAVRAEVTGTLRPDLSALDLAFDAATRDLRLGLPLDPLLAGAGTAAGTVRRAGEDLALDVSARTPLLALDADGGLTGSGGALRFDLAVAQVAPVLPGLSGPATAAGTATRRPDGSLAIAATATAPGASAAVDATVAPAAQGSAIAGTARIEAADLRPFSALAGRPLAGRLSATVTGSAAPDLSAFSVAVDGSAANLHPGNATAARLLAGTGTVSAALSRQEGGAIRVERLAARFPNLSVDATGQGEGRGATVAFDARLADVGLLAPDFSGPVTARGTASTDGATTTLDADVTGPGGIAARVAGSLAGGAASLSAAGSAPLGLLNGFIEPRRIEGAAAFDLRLDGPLALSSLSGTVGTQGARLSAPSFRVAVEGIGGTVALSGGTARVSLSGLLSDGGRIAVAGPVGLSAPFVADLSITGEGLVIRDPTLYEAQASAAIRLSGPLAGAAALAGRVDIASAEVRIPSSGVGALGDLPPVLHIEPSVPVRRTLDRAEVSATGGDGAEAAGGGGGGYALDLTISAPARIFVRGRGLDAELGGELRLTGSTGRIVPAGQLSLLRGRLSILGQRFDLTEGVATLQGDFTPFLRLVAQTQARTGTTVRVILEGPADDLDLGLESVPELPEDEVLAQLIFGRDLTSITPFQAVQLAAAVAELSGRGGGLVDDLRAGAGLADLDLTVDDSGNAALRLGQYVTENVYTDVVVGTEETTATINLDLTPDLTVRAGVSTEGETALGLYYERDY